MISLRARCSSPPRIFCRPPRAFPTRADCWTFWDVPGSPKPSPLDYQGGANSPVLVWWLFCSDKLPGETPVDTCAAGSRGWGPRSPMLQTKRRTRSNCHLERPVNKEKVCASTVSNWWRKRRPRLLTYQVAATTVFSMMLVVTGPTLSGLYQCALSLPSTYDGNPSPEDK
jgi:hypothetical protein